MVNLVIGVYENGTGDACPVLTEHRND